MSTRFFNPWIGDNYWEGIGRNEYCVLVLGASVYCAFNGKRKQRCHHYNECTSSSNQDSSEFNYDCPFPETNSEGDATPLEDYPIYACSRTMDRFGEAMKDRFADWIDGDSFWDHIAFTEYVQYFMNHTYTNSEDLSDRDFDAFLETLDELRPDVVIVWGKVVAGALRESKYAIDADDDEPWDFAWEYDNMFIRFICCTHPASKDFRNKFSRFANQLENTIDL